MRKLLALLLFGILPIVASAQEQKGVLTIECEQDSSAVYINDEFVGYAPISKTLPYGTYNYRIENTKCYPDKGTIEVNASGVKKIIGLAPRYNAGIGSNKPNEALILDKRYTTDPLNSGNCGESLNYSLDVKTGVLKITGTGAMRNYAGTTSAPWNSYLKAVRTIELPEGLTSIGNNAFAYSFNITSVVIPESVTSIGEYAFMNCNDLVSVNIPEGVTSIGKGAFFNCYKLKKVNIPKSASVGEKAFDKRTKVTRK